jgi:hypothetical protein
MLNGIINYPPSHSPSDVRAAKSIAHRLLEQATGGNPDIQLGEVKYSLGSAQLVVGQLGINVVGVDRFQDAIARATDASVFRED